MKLIELNNFGDEGFQQNERGTPTPCIDEVVIKVPKKIEQVDEVAFLDIIYQTQLMQFLKDNRTDGSK